MIRYKGIAYPLTKHHQGFFHNSNTDVEQLKSNLAAIILTEPGERIMNPAFGTPLLSINLNSPKEIVQNNFRQQIAKSIKRWEKRIQVNDVKVNLQTIEAELIVMISIYFIDPMNLNNVEEVHIQKSLGGIDGKRMPF